MRVVIDYRPALRQRTGVGEYIHQVLRALARTDEGDDITVFSSSWKDRPPAAIASELPGVRIADQRIPVRALNFAWHRLGWPAIETVAGGSYDVAHSPHPLVMPSRSAAQVVTIHDLHFLTHPERTTGEIRRDYVDLVSSHARRADRVVVSSQYAAGEVERRLQVPRDRIAVCFAGAPSWNARPAAGSAAGGRYLLFVGTLETRKNIGGLLAAYGRLLSGQPHLPRLVLAGAAGPGAARWLEEISRPPLAGRVEHLGYVAAERREGLFRGAAMLVLPSFEEGFGLPVLEAMAAGVPVVASNRGALPEVIGDAGIIVDPDDPDELGGSVERILREPGCADALVQRGLNRARQFTWERTARLIRQAYQDAVAARRERVAHASHAHRH